MDKPLIILISGKARNGKDTAGKIIKAILETKGKKVLNLAYGDYVKVTAGRNNDWQGTKDEEDRTRLQDWGENVRQIDPNLWTDIVIKFAEALKNEYDYIVVTDCRHRNEIYRWHEFGYNTLTIHVSRKNFDNGLTEEQKKHPSEIGLDDYLFSSYVLAKDIDELHEKIEKYIIPLIENK